MGKGEAPVFRCEKCGKWFVCSKSRSSTGDCAGRYGDGFRFTCDQHSAFEAEDNAQRKDNAERLEKRRLEETQRNTALNAGGTKKQKKPAEDKDEAGAG